MFYHYRSNDVVRAEPTTIEHVLKQHFIRVINKAFKQKLNVRRQELLADCFQQFKRSSFDVTKLLSVTFLTESAIDGGGPRRELFRLLLADLFSISGLFTGYPSSVTAYHNLVALQNGDYRVAVKMVGASIVQAGIAPHCFSCAVADFIVYGEVRSEVKLGDISDPDIRIKMEKVIQLIVYINTCICNTQLAMSSNQYYYFLVFMQIDKAASTDEMISEMEEKDYSFRFDCGFTKPQSAITYSDKQTFFRSVWLHYVIYSVYGELEQFRDGLLETLQIEHIVHEHPEVFWSLIASKDNELTAGCIQDLFEVQYSPKRSNNAKAEQAVIMHWYTFLIECEGMLSN